MRTSADVYHRLMHDLLLEDLKRNTVIGYHDRFKGCMEVELMKFACGGDIPWHRVLYFRHGDFLWHKETRLDHVFNSTDHVAANSPDRIATRLANRQEAEQNRAEAEEAARLKAWIPGRSRVRATIFKNLEKVPIHSHCSLTGNWVALDRCESGNWDTTTTNDEISVCTLNVLSDFHLSEHLKSFSQQRWHHIVDVIEESPCHVWVLTEVDEKFASYLLSCDNIKHTYRSSIGASNKYNGIPTHPSATGQLVLLRRDVACDSVHITKSAHASGKMLTFVAGSLPSGVTFGLCAVHLTSGQKKDGNSSLAQEKRNCQLAEAMKHLEALQIDEEPCLLQIVAGDFNFKSAADDHINAHLLDDFVEAGVHLQRPTYVPSQNSLARLNGSGDDMRLDRIYMKGGQNRDGKSVLPTVSSHVLLATETLQTATSPEVEGSQEGIQLMASDHFGVSTTFSVSGGYNSLRSNIVGGKPWTSTTALALVPNEEYQTFLDEWIRKDHDTTFKKWPAHCNLLFPFVAPELIRATLSDLSDLLVVHNVNSDLLNISFSGISSFRHKVTSNVHLQCARASRDKLRELQTLATQSAEKIAGSRVSKRSRDESEVYNPHVTLAKIRPDSELERTRFLESVEMKFEEVDSERWECVPHTLVALRKCDDIMTVVAEQRLAPIDNESSLTKQTLILLRSLCKLVFNGSSDFTIYPVGSAGLLRGGSAISDVDVVVSAPENYKHMTSSEFADEVGGIMAATGNHRVRKSAGDANIVSIDLRKSHGLLPIDIMFGETKYSLQARDDLEQQSLVLDALIADGKLTRDIFSEALSHVKIWARSRMLTQRAFGLWSGIAWSIMMLAVSRIRHHSNTCELLASFFEFYAAVDWEHEAVSISGLVTRGNLTFLDGRDCRKDGAIVLTPGICTERTNVIRGVSPAVTMCLRREMELARKANNEGNSERWDQFLQTQAPDIREAYASRVVVRFALTKSGNTLIDMANIEGWLKGRFALFSAAELGERGISIRPSSQLDVKEDEFEVTAELVCGIEDSLSPSEPTKRKTLVRHAELQLRDRFLRWDDRPPSATVEVRLEASNPT